MIQFTINGQVIETPEGTTVLRAAEKAGITIPTLCDHPDLTPFGGCRLCVVEVQGARYPATACTLLATPGMVIRTESRQLSRDRRAILQMLLRNYYESGAVDRKLDTQFKYWIKRYGVKLKDSMAEAPRYPVDSDPNPFLRVDMNKCILCTRCIRACAEVQGRFVWAQGGRGAETRIVAGPDTDLISARCESCGACVAYCPTGALDNRMSYSLGHPDKVVTTTCTYCGVGCQFDLNVKDNRIIRVTSNPKSPVNGMHLCVKGRYGYDFVHHPDRLEKPRVRRYLLENQPKPGPGADRGLPGWDWVEVDWDTALAFAARNLSRLRAAYGPRGVGVLCSAKCTNEENYLMNKFARQVVGTNSIDHCARL